MTLFSQDRSRAPSTDGRDVLVGLASGLVAGLAATWAMTRFQIWAGKLAQRLQRKSSGHNGHEEKPSTVRVAEAVSTHILHRPLPPEQEQLAGQAVHYSYGTLIGGVYGVMRELMPAVRTTGGLGYGAAAWFLGDEVMLPLLRISKSPSEYPLSVHATALAAHLVYGGMLDITQRAVGWMIQEAAVTVAVAGSADHEAPEPIRSLQKRLVQAAPSRLRELLPLGSA